MKNTLYLTLFLLGCMTSQLYAQSTRPFRKLTAGVYAGPQLYGKIYATEDLRKISGISAGIDLGWNFSKEKEGFSLHFQPGFNTYRQFMPGDPNSFVNYEGTWKWSALHLPLLARYTFSSGRVRPFAEIGPMLRVRNSLSNYTKRTFCGFTGCSITDFDEDLQSRTNRDAVGIVAGAGIEVDVWKVTIPVTIRTQQGLSTYEMKEMRADASYYDGLKTNTIQVTAGITF